MLLFFDFDGTLSAPRFFTEGRYVHGFTEDGWKAFYMEKGEDTFQHCMPVGAVKRYAQRMKAEGHRLFVLTRAASREENLGKNKFLARYYPDLFDEYYPVLHDADKIPVMKKIAGELHFPEGECVLVEDTYGLVLQAISAGMQGIHVSNLCAEEEFAE